MPAWELQQGLACEMKGLEAWPSCPGTRWGGAWWGAGRLPTLFRGPFPCGGGNQNVSLEGTSDSIHCCCFAERGFGA